MVDLGTAVAWKEARGWRPRRVLASTSGDGVSGTVIWLAAIMSLHRPHLTFQKTVGDLLTQDNLKEVLVQSRE